MIDIPPPSSWRAWWIFATEDTTLLRTLENSLLSKLVLKGRTLDVGGGKGFGYVDRLKIEGTFESVNIEPSLQPTYVADLNMPLPMPDAYYDNVVCFNTIEHVYQEHQLLDEVLRVLRPGGRFIVTVPFLYRRHGNYGDFHRHTADYWQKALLERGLEDAAFSVRPLVWCPLSSALTSLPWFRAGIRGRLSKLFVLALEPLRNALRQRDQARMAYKHWALAFYIDGTKTMTRAAA